MAPTRDDYEALHAGFRWQVPARTNIAELCCARWARSPGRTAIVFDRGDGRVETTSYRDLHRAANRLANALAALGVKRGDRVAIVLPQRPETAVAHFAIYRLGAIAMPLSILFGPDALQYRLENSEAVAAIVDAGHLEAVRAARPDCLRHLIAVGPAGGPGANGELDWDSLLARGSDRFAPVRTQAADAAVLIYTSGTTGPPKGALIPHSAIIGNLPGFVASQDWFPLEGDVFWSPADWAWTGGLMDALLPTLYFGMPIVAGAGRFGPERACELIERHRVTNAFLFPTALKMMMKHDPTPGRGRSLALRAIMSAGESVGATLFDWCRDAFGLSVNEMYGQTEANYIVGNSALRWPARPGSIGRPYPGHRVALIDDAGRELPPGELGEVAVNRFDRHGHPDPVFFLGYWRNEPATRAKLAGDWWRTGDLATMDADGYLWYGGRADDMFKSAGYRIGPSEIENCLVQHPAVGNAAVVPKPDPERGNLVKAYVVLAPGREAGDALVAELQQHVRGKLAPYEYPKEIEFIDELPMTTTGKVQRRVLRLREEERALEAGGAEPPPRD
ncbi:MAG: AMP-binding protein [Lautropia sp. SCN 70-15]|nr:MAG: AMP-binding protein [Lautropia sp. SCN 70-15]